MIREKGSDATRSLCVCGRPLAEGAARGGVCSDCSGGQPAEREMAAAVNLRELGS